MQQRKLSQTINEFVNVLIEEELEPLRLDLIRVENDLKTDFDEKFEVLKTAIEELATRISEAIAEGLSEQEEQHSANAATCEKLEERVAALEKRLGNIVSSFVQ